MDLFCSIPPSTIYILLFNLILTSCLQCPTCLVLAQPDKIYRAPFCPALFQLAQPFLVLGISTLSYLFLLFLKRKKKRSCSTPPGLSQTFLTRLEPILHFPVCTIWPFPILHNSFLLCSSILVSLLVPVYQIDLE